MRQKISELNAVIIASAGLKYVVPHTPDSAVLLQNTEAVCDAAGKTN